MYTSLAGLYDRLMDDVDYAAWARAYYSLVAGRLGRTPKTVLECACGTGALTVHVARWGARLVASDLSTDMLEAAGERLRKSGLRVPLTQMDLRAIAVPRPVEAIIACCDGVNYLQDTAALSAFAQSAHAALAPGGVLAFDISTRAKLLSMHGQTYCDEREDIAAIWHNAFDEKTACLTMDVSIYIRQDSGLYSRTEEVHVQRGHTREELSLALTGAGFADIAFFGEDGREQAGERAMRMHVVCTRK